MRLQGRQALLKFVEMIGGYQLKDRGWEWVGSNSLKRQLKIGPHTSASFVSHHEFIRIGGDCGCDFTRADMDEERDGTFVTHWWVIP